MGRERDDDDAMMMNHHTPPHKNWVWCEMGNNLDHSVSHKTDGPNEVNETEVVQKEVNEIEVGQKKEVDGTEVESLFNDENIVWFQQSEAISEYNKNYKCTVFAVGVNFDAHLIYVHFKCEGDNSLGHLQPASSSKLRLDGSLETWHKCSKTYFESNGPLCVNGCLQFDYHDDAEKWALSPLETGVFIYGSGGYKAAMLTLPEQQIQLK